MRIVAIMPIKLKNERCPGKNTRQLGDKPLLQYELDSLKETGQCYFLIFLEKEKMYFLRLKSQLVKLLYA